MVYSDDLRNIKGTRHLCHIFHRLIIDIDREPCTDWVVEKQTLQHFIYILTFYAMYVVNIFYGNYINNDHVY